MNHEGRRKLGKPSLVERMMMMMMMMMIIIIIIIIIINLYFMNKKTKNTFLIDIAVPNTHNLAKTITENQNIPRTGK